MSAILPPQIFRVEKDYSEEGSNMIMRNIKKIIPDTRRCIPEDISVE
jgi:hypothetical protein